MVKSKSIIGTRVEVFHGLKEKKNCEDFLIFKDVFAAPLINKASIVKYVQFLLTHHYYCLQNIKIF